jgi:preprotein translocase subunit SecA
MGVLSLINRTATQTGHRRINSGIQSIIQRHLELQDMNDEAFKKECASLQEKNGFDSDKAPKPRATFSQLFSKISSFSLFKKDVSAATIAQVAAGVEAFRRCPADLPQGSELYHEQIKAAVALTQSCLVQMNTGEGKTYALLPAIFSLLCKYKQVYVVCANKYLARRDAQRTLSYWKYLGISVGIGMYQSQENVWERQVIYSTLDDLMFKQLGDDIDYRKPTSPIRQKCIVLDEADSILLDQAGTNYTQPVAVSGKIYDWSLAVHLAESIDSRLIEADAVDLTASLSIEGEDWLRSKLHDQFGNDNNYQLYRHAVELSYVGIRLAKMDIDYIIEDNRLHRVNRNNGLIEYYQTKPWFLPLQYKMRMPIGAELITRIMLNPRIFLRQFQHISGLSGTVAPDALEYLLMFRLLTITIPPRFKRHKGETDDVLSFTKESSIAALLDAVVNAWKDGRPVLVGTQNIMDAKILYQNLEPFARRAGDKLRLSVIAGQAEENIASIFNHAGEPGSILIATQIAGRGVDIRFTEKAKEAGGLALFCLQHSPLQRHDKQFLGRAGRQGDPFTATFFISTEDELSVNLGLKSWGKFMNKFMEKGETVQNKMLTKRLRQAQRIMRDKHLMDRLTSSNRIAVDNEIYTSIKKWLDIQKQDSEKNNFYCSAAVIDECLESFLNTYVPVLYKKRNKNIVDAEAEKCVEIIHLMIETDEKLFTASNIAQTTGDQAIKVIKKKISARITDCMEKGFERFSVISSFYTKRELLNGRFWPIFYCLEPLKQIVAEQSHQVQDEMLPANGTDAPVVAEPLPVFTKIEQHVKKFYDHIDDAAFDYDTWNNVLKNELKNVQGASEARLIVHLLHELSGEIHKRREETDAERKKTDKDYEKLHKRTPRTAVNWTIQNASINLSKERSRIWHQVYNISDKGLESSRLYCDKISAYLDESNAKLTANILHNLLQSHRLETIDDVFYYSDNLVSTAAEKPSEETIAINIWNEQTTTPLLKTPGRAIHKKYVRRFIVEYENQITDDVQKSGKLNLTVQKLEEQWLSQFVSKYPVSALNTAKKVQKALDEWRIYVKEFYGDNYAYTRRCRIIHKWVKNYLLFLKQHNIIPAVPTFKTSVVSRFDRLMINLTDTRTVLAVVQPALVAAVFILLSFIGHWLPPRQLNAISLHADNLLTGGLVSKGAITALIVPMIFLNKYRSDSQLLRFITFLILPVAAFLWLTGWTWGNWSITAIGTAVGLTAVMYFLFWQLDNNLDKTQRLTGVSLEYIWLLWAICFCFIPAASDVPVIMPALVLTAGAFTIWKLYVNKASLLLQSLHVVDSMKSEQMRNVFHATGFTGPLPHLLAMVFTYFGFHALQSGYANALVPEAYRSQVYFGFLIAVYVFISFVSIQDTLARRFNKNWWYRYLHNRNLALIDTDSNGNNVRLDLPLEMEQHKRYFLRNELMITILLLGILSIVFRNQTLANTGFPIVFVLLPVSVMLAEIIVSLSRQLYQLFFSRYPSTGNVFQSLQLSIYTDDDEDKRKGFWSRFIPRNRSFWLVGVSLALPFVKTVAKLIWDVIANIIANFYTD